jgi:DMSO/TMAO reductase YedYZ molybdopterin-dependent catalytic subunit
MQSGLQSTQHLVPKMKLETWRLLVSGLIENELSLSFRQLQRLPQGALTRDFLE